MVNLMVFEEHCAHGDRRADTSIHYLDYVEAKVMSERVIANGIASLLVLQQESNILLDR